MTYTEERGSPLSGTAVTAPADPSAEIRDIFDAELDTASTAESRGQKIYRSVKVLGQIIGGEYGDRVLFESEFALQEQICSG